MRSPAPPPQASSVVDLANLPLAPPIFSGLVPPAPSRVDVLIAQVERDFHLGEQDYQANRLAEARQHFDTAINRLMASGLNFSVDPRLEPLMNRLIDTMHRYEMTTQQAGFAQTPEASGQEEQATEPSSPLEEIASAANLPENPELDQKAASELLHVPHDLPITVNQPVLSFLNFFQTPRGRAIIEHSLARSGRYMSMVKGILKKEGLPQDLMYLPLPESGYQPRALSRKRALGLWQFTPSAGRLYGLKMNRWEDQRMDPTKSTEAAADYLRDLYGMFHDWYLALAAYDSGPLTVARAIERTGYADFWQLYRLNALPLETKNYVPIMLAMTLVAKDPALYGVQVTDPEPPLKMDSFKPGRSLDLRLAADAVGVKVETLRKMNPELFGVITPDDPDFVLHVPAGTLGQLRTTLAAIPPSRWVGWRLWRVTPQDTLAELASRYHVTQAKIVEANDLATDAALTTGALLLIPAPVAPAVIYYRVRSGDTLGGIARRYRVSVYELRLWNHLRSNLIHISQLLVIHARQSVTGFEEVSSRRDERRQPARETDAPGGQIHLARYGDTLFGISRRYGVTVEALRAANPEIAQRGLKAGDRVVIP